MALSRAYHFELWGDKPKPAAHSIQHGEQANKRILFILTPRHTYLSQFVKVFFLIFLFACLMFRWLRWKWIHMHATQNCGTQKSQVQPPKSAGVLFYSRASLPIFRRQSHNANWFLWIHGKPFFFYNLSSCNWMSSLVILDYVALSLTVKFTSLWQIP